MGAAVSVILPILVPVATAVVALLANLRSQPAGDHPTHNDIEEANRLQQEQQERDRVAQAAQEEADRLAQVAEMNAQQARAAQTAMEAAQAEAERIRRESEEARVGMRSNQIPQEWFVLFYLSSACFELGAARY